MPPTPRFYWETRGERLVYEPHKRYLVYFCGCFAPPHKGHFSVVQEVLQHGSHVRAFVHQSGDERRHGVPYPVNRWIWKTYAKHLLAQDRVTIRHMGTMDSFLSHRFVDHADTIVFMRGDETSDPRSQKHRHASEVEAKTLKRFKSAIAHLRSLGKQVVFVYSARPQAKTLSASCFVRSLLQTKRDRHKRHMNTDLQNLGSFLPDGLPTSVSHTILTKLLHCDLHE